MTEEGSRVFALVADALTRTTLFCQALEYQEMRLQIKSFRLDKLTPQKALATYRRIIDK
jgi:hypothetical protein